MAQKHNSYEEKPMTRFGSVQGPSRRYRRLRNPFFDAAVWADKNPLLQRGEFGIEADTHRVKAGDGVTYWNDLPYVSDVIAHWGDIVGDITDQTDLTQYITDAVDAEAQLRADADDGLQDQITDNKGTMDNHIADTNNPHQVTKTQVGLGNVDNTSDLDKPISTATQSALDLKANIADLATVATSGSYTDLINKPTIGDATLTIQKNGTTVDSFTANATSNKTINITVPTTAADVNALPDSTKYTANVSMTINSSTYVVTLQLKDQDGNNIGTAQTIDLPLESVVVSGSYDSATKEVVLTLQDGSTIRFSVADLVSGLQTEITVNNMLDADLVDDSTSTNKFVTSSDITTWNAKQDALTAGSNITISGTTISATDTTYTGSDGITLTGTNFTNSGVRSVSTGSTNGTISVNTNGTSADVAVYGLGSAAYTASTSYATSAQGALADTAVQPGDLATVATTGDYDDLFNKPTIPTVNDATLTIQKNGTNVATFTANASSAVTANISVPTDTNDLTNGAGYITGITSGDVTTALGYTPANNTDVVHKTGTETITGAKTFENTDSVSASLTALTLKGDNLHKGTNPSSNHFNSIEFTDDSDVNIAKFSAIQTSDGWTGFLAGAGSDPTAPQNNLLMIANGTSKLLLIPATSSHASCAVRRDFFNNNAVKHTPSTAVGSSTQPIYVASDGTATACSLATVASTGAYSDLSGTPTIPTVNNPTITITQGGVTKGSFTLNQASGDTIALDAGGGGSVDIDNSTITKNGSNQLQAVATINANTAIGATNPVYDWVGTLAEYTTQDVATNHPDWVCYITDDQEATAYQAYTQSQCNNLFVQKGHQVIEFQEPTSANNYTWYRKYADGWIEQGGKVSGSSSSAAINFPVTMANSKYYINGHVYGNTDQNVNWIKFGTRTTTGTTYVTGYGANNLYALTSVWEVKGMAA